MRTCMSCSFPDLRCLPQFTKSPVNSFTLEWQTVFPSLPAVWHDLLHGTLDYLEEFRTPQLFGYIFGGRHPFFSIFLQKKKIQKCYFLKGEPTVATKTISHWRKCFIHHLLVPRFWDSPWFFIFSYLLILYDGWECQ